MPECDVGDSNREIIYDQPWLKYVIPRTSNDYENCVRYAPLKSNNSSTTNQCGADRFNTSRHIGCTEFIYKTDETNIQTEVNKMFVVAVMIIIRDKIRFSSIYIVRIAINLL